MPKTGESRWSGDSITRKRRSCVRFRGLYGAACAAALAGARDRASVYFTELLTLAEHADTERHEILHARRFTGR